MFFLALPLALLLSVLLVPLVRRLSFRVGRVAQPRKDRWHSTPTPTLGGVGMFLAFLPTVLTVAVLSGQLAHLRWSLLVSAVLMFAWGLYDDFKRITPPAKLVGQILAASLVIFFGDWIHFFPWEIANIGLTFVWLVGITNAINLLDNMDGLAGGVALIAAAVLTYFLWRADSQALLIISLALVGSILGFLIFNFPPAKIFMGDSGSLFLGFTLAALSVARRTQASNVLAVMAVPTLVFLLPIIDTSLVTITRLLRGQSPTQGGTDHTSHRLVAFGLTERQAVLFLYGVAFTSGVAAAAFEALDYDLSLVLIPLLVIALLLFTAYLGRLKVVATIAPPQGNIARLMVNLTYKRRLFEIALDFLLIALCFYLAFWTSLGLNLNDQNLNQYLQALPVAFATAFLSFYMAGIYRGVWQYLSISDFLRHFWAALGSAALSALILVLVYPQRYALDIFLLYAVFLFLGLATSRSSFQILDRLAPRRRQEGKKEKVLIYGASDAGEMALRWILRNPDLGYVPVGFVDDDAYKWGRSIHEVSVLGGLQQLGEILEYRQIGGVIIASAAGMSAETMSGLIAICRQKGAWLRVMHLDFELLQ